MEIKENQITKHVTLCMTIYDKTQSIFGTTITYDNNKLINKDCVNVLEFNLWLVKYCFSISIIL